MQRWKITINGIVQGVGFRPTVFRYAQAAQLTGFCRNDGQGVVIEVQGRDADLAAFCLKLKTFPPPQAHIQTWRQEVRPLVAKEKDFKIAFNQCGERKNTLIGPDLALCEQCRQEIFDPHQRRYHYPFTNCTNCGPRFTIIYDRPYERAQTVMRAFKMCPLCQQEYDDPQGRRFHAEPNACPVCGPQLRWGEVQQGIIKWQDHLTSEVILSRLQEFLAQGKIGALKGIGGFHLVGDAAQINPVQRLRQLKNRKQQALAVMLRPSTIAQYAWAWGLGQEIYEHYLYSAIAPIMLLPKPLADVPDWMNAVAPDTNYVGAMVPYTPLHALVMEHFTALVMTSANLHEEPLAINEAQLAPCLPYLDFVLTHNRPILRACDDSIGQIIGGKISWIRWGRGLVPQPFGGLVLNSSPSSWAPGVALGALQKNNFVLSCAAGEQANALICSQHIGEMQDVRNLDFQQAQRNDFQRLWNVTPTWLAREAHPAFAPCLAPEETKLPAYKILHHHAHAFAALAEHQLLQQEAWILTADGNGMGADQTIWGMEWWHYKGKGNENGRGPGASAANDLNKLSHFMAHPSLTRIGTLRPIKLLGGEKAVYEVSRVALAMLLDLQELMPFDAALFRPYLGPYTLAQAQQIWASPYAIPASSLGRLFDGVAAIGLGLGQIEYQAQAAMLWQQAAENYAAQLNSGRIRPNSAAPWPQRRYRRAAYAFGDHPTLLELDYRPMLAALCEEQAQGAKKEYLAYQFHRWLTAAILEMAQELLPPQAPLIFTGGCAQNKLLGEMLRATAKRPILQSTLLPPNDASIALGQAVAVAQTIFAE